MSRLLSPSPSSPSWTTAVLVCKACGKRGSGPRKLKPKDVVREVREALGRTRPKPRVVMTSCLGLCPKRAMAVAVVGRGGEPLIAAVGAAGDVGRLVESMTRPAAAARPSDPQEPALER